MKRSSLALIAPAADGPVTADQFARLMQAAHGSVADISFIYEGELRFVGPKALLGKITVDMADERFQGVYSSRNDGAEWLDCYVKSFRDPSPVMRFVGAGLRGDFAEIKTSTDSPLPTGGPKPRQSGYLPGVLSGIRTPGSLLYRWLFLAMSRPQDWAYRYQGWEVIDGRTCLRIQLNDYAGSTEPGRAFSRYWIDLERGGHPLHVEVYRDSTLYKSVEGVTLARVVPAQGEPIWLPIKGTMFSYRWQDRDYKSPVLKHTVAIVSGSVLVNIDLPDGWFSVENQGGGLPQESVLKKLRVAARSIGLRQEFDRTAKLTKAPRLRTDPDGVRAKLDMHLAEAERQAKQLDASAAGSEAYNWTLAFQIGLGTISLSVLAFAAYSKLKAR